jgi:hypothetical protein
MFISLEHKKSWQVSQDLKPKTSKHTTGVVSNRQLRLFILLTMKCCKTVFTWIQETTFFFFCTFESEKWGGALQSHTKLNIVSIGIFLKTELRGVVLFSGKQYTIMVLYYYHNIQLYLAYECTKHKQLKITSDVRMEQSTWPKWSYQYTQFPEPLTHQSQHYYYYTYLSSTFKYIITWINDL